MRETFKTVWRNKHVRSIVFHLSSVLAASIFVVLGGLIFYALENDNYTKTIAEHKIAREKAEEVLIMRLWHLAKVEKVSREDFGRLSEEEYFSYVDAFYNETGGTKSRSRGKDGSLAELWSFSNAIYFAAKSDFLIIFFNSMSYSMLTTIGYGFIAPATFWGRGFSVVYGLLGIPLMLITVGNVAKFASELLFLVYRAYLALRFECMKKTNDEEDAEMLNNVDKYMHKVKLFRFPAWSLFIFVLLYGLAAAVLFTYYEDWTIWDSLYFTMISICTVGFGDVRPSEENQWFILMFVLIGVTITTMAMEIIGTMYLEELHFIGRQIRDKNPWTVLRAARLEKRRRETANLLVGLAQFMAMTPPQRKKTRRAKSKKEKKNKKLGKKISFAHEKAIGRIMFSKSPPDTPNECQILSTSAHCIRLAWNPPFPQVGLTTYSVTCRPKHTDKIRKRNQSSLSVNNSPLLKNSPSRRIRRALNRVAPDEPRLVIHGIIGCSFEVTNLESCSLYELTVTACNEFGTSKAKRLIEYTEPELSPQHVTVEKIGANAIRCDWEPPLKRTAHITGYVVYYTDARHGTHYDCWRRAELPVTQCDYRLAALEYDTFYRMCVRAVYIDGSFSPLSRAVVIRTEKLGFRPCLVGQSKSLELMEGLTDSKKHKTFDDETLPLLGDHHVYKHRSRYSMAC